MYVCVLDEKGEIREHRNMNTNPESFLAAVAPVREDVVVAVECMFTWYWLADLCADDGIAFVLGHALAMKAIHGGKAKTDKIVVFKKKRRHNYRRKAGHRQQVTLLKITAIGGEAKKAAPKKAKAAAEEAPAAA